MSVALTFDRATGRLEGASAMERIAAFAYATGSRLSKPMHHRGFGLGAKAVSAVVPPREIVVQLNDDARFAFPFGDGYWSLLLDPQYEYEPEIERFLMSVADVDYALVDGGANFGYWSVLASSRPFGSHSVVAIEASSRNAEKLSRNAALNGGRFKVLRRAIGGSSGGTVFLGGAKHEALRVGGESGAAGGESVEMISLDGLLDQGHVAPGQKLIVKLDVEGMEVDAMRGGSRLMEGDCVLMLEEHGGDRDHSVSRYVLEKTPWKLFIFDERTGRNEPVTDLKILDRIKTSSNFGYTVFATPSEFWVDKLRSIPPLSRR